ncbi:hypothetical protein ACN27E_19820 [Mycobacterium sp. WMMD1722]|uniref:hypothetical protein n=1 Tax=Mycobacterium sp. WMMD1722 TaxID=3404117 RepID=UPI003BF5C08F
MTALRTTLLGLLLGVGILLAGAAGAAAADPGDSGVSAGGSAGGSSVGASTPGSSAVSRSGPRSAGPSTTDGRSADRAQKQAETGKATAAEVAGPQDDRAATVITTGPVDTDGVSDGQGGRHLPPSSYREPDPDPKQELSALSADLARSHTGVEPATATVSPQATGIHGDPETNKQYWYRQERGCPTCVLMSVASVVGQLSPTHTMPTQQEIIDLAKSTDSDAKPGFKIFESGGTGAHWGTHYIDAVKLLDKFDIDAVQTEFTKNQTEQALRQLTTALDDRAGVIVSIRPDTLWDSARRMLNGQDVRSLKPTVDNAYHAIVVTAVDVNRRIVWVNDSDLDVGAGLALPLDAFLRAWQASSYTSVIGRARPVNTAAQPAIAA